MRGPDDSPLFDRYLAVDWSANNRRKLGKDSIWSCVADRSTNEPGRVTTQPEELLNRGSFNEFVAAVVARSASSPGWTFRTAIPPGSPPRSDYTTTRGARYGAISPTMSLTITTTEATVLMLRLT